ncbi:hypothetical protein HNP93_000744 [Methanococcus maripaludis]|uniref:Uncharacterized protein n=1 Tax=Methanococcus maripaludis TaxID=39152 RepID=A0A7J9P4B3_METMI|nr:DUF2226 domain-containing protein [Methanococcus maripaludis]MBA2858043.1 hypothetical protein [Methanococcus maripaludis]
MDIIEGKFVKMGSSYKELFDELPENFIGHVRLSLKVNGQFKESHLFLNNKKIIGGYSDYEGEFFGNDAVVNAMKMAELGAIVDIFSYTDSMLSMMQNSNKKLFLTNETVKKSPVEKKKAIVPNNGRISVPEGKPVKLGVSNDFEKYLGKYTLLELFKKIDGTYHRGYVAYNGNLPVTAVYQTENKLIFGNNAFEMFNDIINEDNDFAIDVYEYNNSKLNYFIGEYPESVISIKPSEPVKSEMPKTELPQYVQEVKDFNEYLEKDDSETENSQKVEEDISREDLMKKLGIRTPTDDMIENLLDDVFEPSKTEMGAIENELLEKINDYFNENSAILEFETELSIEYSDDDEFIATCCVNTTSDENSEVIKKDIEDIFDSYIIEMTSNVTVNNKKTGNTSETKTEHKSTHNKYDIDLQEELNKIKAKNSNKEKTGVEGLKEKIEHGIYEYLENVHDISEFEVHMSITEDNGYKCKCSIIVVPKKMLGFIKSSLNTDKIERDISDILGMNNVKIEFLNITVEKFTTSYSRYK